MLAASTLARKRRELEHDLNDILKAPGDGRSGPGAPGPDAPGARPAPDLRGVPGNGRRDEQRYNRALRPAVVQRKATNGYRAMWAAKGEANVRTVIATAALRTKATPFATLLATIAA